MLLLLIRLKVHELMGKSLILLGNHLVLLLHAKLLVEYLIYLALASLVSSVWHHLWSTHPHVVSLMPLILLLKAIRIVLRWVEHLLILLHVLVLGMLLRILSLHGKILLLLLLLICRILVFVSLLDCEENL